MRRLLFFPGHRLLAYEWERGAFRRVEAFEPDEDGRRAFREWLAAAPRTPVQLLLDVIEEEFHIDHIPHVIGRDRAELLRRTARKHFRGTDFRYIERQGRESRGRRDDRVLIAGLSNPDLLRVWTDTIVDVGVPLKGIHSLPLVGERLLPHLGAGRASRALVVSQQVASTLRQSYYENGKLRFSRLVPGRYSDTAGFREFVEQQLHQTLHFLETQRFRRENDPVEVFVIAGPDDREVLREGLASEGGVKVHLVPLEGLASAVGMRGPLPGPYADTVFGQVLLRQLRPTNHYGLPRLRRGFYLQRARQGLWAGAAALLLAAVVVGAGGWLQGHAYEAGAQQARERAERFERLYRQRLRQLDAFEYRATDVKSAVDLLSRLAEDTRAGPGATMAAVGSALGGHPRVVLQRLSWWVSAEADPGSLESGGEARGGGEIVPATLADRAMYHHAVIRGELVDFDGDYRRAVELFEAFLADLRDSGFFREVVVLKAPFDLDPQSGFSGQTGTGAGDTATRAQFRIRLRHVEGGNDGAD